MYTCEQRTERSRITDDHSYLVPEDLETLTYFSSYQEREDCESFFRETISFDKDPKDLPYTLWRSWHGIKKGIILFLQYEIKHFGNLDKLMSVRLEIDMITYGSIETHERLARL